MRVWITLLVLAAAACEPIVHRPNTGPDAGESRLPDGGRSTGSPDAAPTPDGQAATTPTMFLQGWETKTCAAAFACRNNYPNNTGQTFTQAYGQTVTDCNAIMLSYDMPSTVETQVTAGAIQFNPTSADSCISSIAYTCNNYWDNGVTYTGNSCPTALVGSVQNGGNCLTTWQCQSWTSYCDAGTHKCTAE